MVNGKGFILKAEQVRYFIQKIYLMEVNLMQIAMNAQFMRNNQNL